MKSTSIKYSFLNLTKYFLEFIVPEISGLLLLSKNFCMPLLIFSIICLFRVKEMFSGSI